MKRVIPLALLLLAATPPDPQIQNLRQQIQLLQAKKDFSAPETHLDIHLQILRLEQQILRRQESLQLAERKRAELAEQQARSHAADLQAKAQEAQQERARLTLQLQGLESELSLQQSELQRLHSLLSLKSREVQLGLIPRAELSTLQAQLHRQQLILTQLSAQLTTLTHQRETLP